MKAEELRIGNYVQYGDGELKIDINVLYDIDVYNALGTQGIPLTEEWLLKFGFTKGNQAYQDGFSLVVLETDLYLRPAYVGGFYWGFNISDKKLDCELNDVRPIQYVHQLQNLYFALTGEELTIK